MTRFLSLRCRPAPRCTAVGIVGYGLACLVAVLLFSVCVQLPAFAHDRVPVDASAQHYFLTYLSAPEVAPQNSAPSTWHPPQLLLSFGGASINAVLDSNTTGIVVPARLVPHAALRRGVPGIIHDARAQRVLRGWWVRLVTTISGANGVAIRTEPIAVFAVERSTCPRHAGTCASQPRKATPAVIGIGFSHPSEPSQPSTLATDAALNPRATSSQMSLAPPTTAPPGRPAYAGDAINPFLHLARGRAALPITGYVITRHGVRVGLSGIDHASGFVFVKLQPSNSPGDRWQPAPVCLLRSAATQRLCGALLVSTRDTGLSLTLPATVPQASEATLRTQGIDLLLTPNTHAAVIGYQLQLGPDIPDDQTGATRITFAPNTLLVSTSGALLNSFDILYDHQNGYTAYRRINEAAL